MLRCDFADGLRRQPARGKISLLKRAIDALHKAVEPPGNYSFRTNQLPQKRKAEPSLFGDLSGTETEEVPELLLRLPTRHLTPSPVKRDSCILPPAEQVSTEHNTKDDKYHIHYRIIYCEMLAICFGHTLLLGCIQAPMYVGFALMLVLLSLLWLV